MRRLRDGVRVRVVLPRVLAEKVVVLAHNDWCDSQEWIRRALEIEIQARARVQAEALGLSTDEWWQGQLDSFRGSLATDVLVGASK